MNKLFTLLLISFSMMLGLSAQTNPPMLTVTIMPSGDQSVLVGHNITFSGSATGGTSPYTYKWTFAAGTPMTSSNPSEKVEYDTSGKDNTVKVIATDSSKPAKTASATAKVTVQKPKSLKFVSSGEASAGGGRYTFTVLDENMQPIKNAPLSLQESIPSFTAHINYATGSSEDIPAGGITGNPTDGPTDGSGNLIDGEPNPVGIAYASLIPRALAERSALILTFGPFVHSYISVTDTDKKTVYSMVKLNQTQQVIETIAIANGGALVNTPTITPGTPK